MWSLKTNIMIFFFFLNAVIAIFSKFIVACCFCYLQLQSMSFKTRFQTWWQGTNAISQPFSFWRMGDFNMTRVTLGLSSFRFEIIQSMTLKALIWLLKQLIWQSCYQTDLSINQYHIMGLFYLAELTQFFQGLAGPYSWPNAETHTHVRTYV